MPKVPWDLATMWFHHFSETNEIATGRYANYAFVVQVVTDSTRARFRKEKNLLLRQYIISHVAVPLYVTKKI